jgi:hypothetical protein
MMFADKNRPAPEDAALDIGSEDDKVDMVTYGVLDADVLRRYAALVLQVSPEVLEENIKLLLDAAESLDNGVEVLNDSVSGVLNTTCIEKDDTEPREIEATDNMILVVLEDGEVPMLE